MSGSTQEWDSAEGFGVEAVHILPEHLPLQLGGSGEYAMRCPACIIALAPWYARLQVLWSCYCVGTETRDHEVPRLLADWSWRQGRRHSSLQCLDLMLDHSNNEISMWCLKALRFDSSFAMLFRGE